MSSTQISGGSEFYQIHLDRVSRSFAFCIRQLPEPLRAWVGLSYLLCRILDTIEDSPWSEPELQVRAFRLFDKALLNGVTAPFDECEFPAEINASERALVAEARIVFKDLHELPAPVAKMIRELVHSMSLGMQHFARSNKPGTLRLKTLSEVNQYCFFVAGVVGELLCKLLAAVEPRFELNQLNVLRAHHFGLFLQKVNLLKDQVVDEKSGRHLLPSRQLVEDSAEGNAKQAFEFLVDLPKEQIEFRRFCAWSFFLGLEAIYASKASVQAQSVIKVSREKAAEIVASVEDALNDGNSLRSLGTAAFEKLGWRGGVDRTPMHSTLPSWLIEFYAGGLKTVTLQELDLSPHVN